jgi:hypothetical protein
MGVPLRKTGKEDADALRVSLRAVGVSHVEIEEKISD